MSSIIQVVKLVEDKLKILLENYNFLKEENEHLIIEEVPKNPEDAKRVMKKLANRVFGN